MFKYEEKGEEESGDGFVPLQQLLSVEPSVLIHFSIQATWFPRSNTNKYSTLTLTCSLIP